jgi:hypothetical protein
MQYVDWTVEYLEKKPGLTESQVRILTDGPRQLSEAWALGAMKRDWEKTFKTRSGIEE